MKVRGLPTTRPEIRLEGEYPQTEGGDEFLHRVDGDTLLFTTDKNTAILCAAETKAVHAVHSLPIRGEDLNKNYVPGMVRYLRRVGYKVSDLAKLNILHVTGTKGKGSTSTFCESILRHHGYRTGVFRKGHLFNPFRHYAQWLETLSGKDKKKVLFLGIECPTEMRRCNVYQCLSFLHVRHESKRTVSILRIHCGYLPEYRESIRKECGDSPHLMSLTERFLINGKPITQDVFTDFFWNIHDKLSATKEFEDDMPERFPFFTLMAFDLFLKHEVDALVLEVGVGGEYDATNVIEAPVVCGVTSIHMDHQNVLGNTLRSIGWHKSGIFKSSAPALTIPQHPDVMSQLKTRARERQTTLIVVPTLSRYETEKKPVRLGIQGDVQRSNATLALNMCRVWLEKRKQGNVILPSDRTRGTEVSQVCHQTFQESSTSTTVPSDKQPSNHYRLTEEEMKDTYTETCLLAFAEWFQQETAEEKKKIKGRVAQILLFHSVDRDLIIALSIFKNIPFDAVIFSPYFSKDKAYIETFYPQPSWEEQLERSLDCKKIWDNLQNVTGDIHKKEPVPAGQNTLSDLHHVGSATRFYTPTRGLSVGNTSIQPPNPTTSSPSFVLPYLQQALKVASQNKDTNILSTDDSISKPLLLGDMPQSVSNADHIQVLIAGGHKIVAHSLWYLQAAK